jgi:Fe-S-cluster-containing hydrogenase component 2
LYRPLRSLREGNWFKLICGASFQHLPAVRSLTLAYALAGADCIDVAADPAVVAAVQEALRAVVNLTDEARARGYDIDGLPWIMVSLSDGEDPHFRKAEFDPATCPSDCLRPCEQICPVGAIVFSQPPGFSGVTDSLCYGCGRCLSICPIQQISARSYVSTAAVLAPLVLAGVDAVEIHTQVGRFTDFNRLWQAIQPSVHHLQLIAISCPDGEGLIDYLWSLYELISPLPCALVWQTDGRPMSGDLGIGTTKAAVQLGRKVLAGGLPGYVQLAGGTNRHTVSKLQALGLMKQPATHAPYIAGVAYGSYARSILAPILDKLETLSLADGQAASSAAQSATLGLTASLPARSALPLRLEEYPALLWEAVDQAHTFVSEVKLSPSHPSAHPAVSRSLK